MLSAASKKVVLIDTNLLNFNVLLKILEGHKGQEGHLSTPLSDSSSLDSDFELEDIFTIVKKPGQISQRTQAHQNVENSEEVEIIQANQNQINADNIMSASVVGDTEMPKIDQSFTTIQSTAGFNISRQSLPTEMLSSTDNTPRDQIEYITPVNSKFKVPQRIPNTAPPVLAKNNYPDPDVDPSSSSDGEFLDSTCDETETSSNFSELNDGDFTILDGTSPGVAIGTG